MYNFEEITVAQLVTENIKTADVFKKNGIDFCCGGKVKIVDICKRKGVDFEEIKTDLEAVFNSTSASHNYNDWELDFLVDFIVNTHHVYVAENSGLLIQYANRVAEVHGNDNPNLIKIKDLIHTLVADLQSHMLKEENVLFPYVKELVKAKKESSGAAQPHFGTVKNPVSAMEHEHDMAGDIVKELAVLTHNYTPPAMACNTYRALFSKMEEFQNDLFQHIHLENNILFPKAIQLEAKLGKR